MLLLLVVMMLSCCSSGMSSLRDILEVMDHMVVADLRRELRKLGASASGLKPALQVRLRDELKKAMEKEKAKEKEPESEPASASAAAAAAAQFNIGLMSSSPASTWRGLIVAACASDRAASSADVEFNIGFASASAAKEDEAVEQEQEAGQELSLIHI